MFYCKLTEVISLILEFRINFILGKVWHKKNKNNDNNNNLIHWDIKGSSNHCQKTRYGINLQEENNLSISGFFYFSET